MILRTTRGVWDQGQHKMVGLTSRIWSGLVTAGQQYLCQLEAEARNFALAALPRDFELEAEHRTFMLEGEGRCH